MSLHSSERSTPTATAAGGILDHPGCLVHLDNIKARWINAGTACLAHETTLARNERFRRWNNWITLVLAVLTAVFAVLLPVAVKTRVSS